LVGKTLGLTQCVEKRRGVNRGKDPFLGGPKTKNATRPLKKAQIISPHNNKNSNPGEMKGYPQKGFLRGPGNGNPQEMFRGKDTFPGPGRKESLMEK